MSLNLGKNRKATHSHIAVAGSYTDTYIEVQGSSATSIDAQSYIRWVPNKNPQVAGYNPSFSGINSSMLASEGYVELLHSNAYFQDGYGLLRFEYRDNTTYTSTSLPGIKDVSFTGYNSTVVTELADELINIMDGVYGDCVFVLYSVGDISSSAELYEAMGRCKSWRHRRVLGTNKARQNYSYAAVGTNVNNIGLLSEALQGDGANHENAGSELAIEHDRNTIGHAGYGEDLSSGIGSGERTNYIENSTTILGPVFVNWNDNDAHNISVGEYVRATFMSKVGQYTGQHPAGVSIYFREDGQASNEYYFKNIDQFGKHEVLYQRKSASSSFLEIQGRLSTGSGTSVGQGTGTGSDRYSYAKMRDLEVMKAGFSPDQDRDVAVHQWHTNALNVIESPADFDLKDPDDFVNFYNSSRNIVDTTQKYPMDIVGSGTIANIANWQYHNATYPAAGAIGYNNWVKWFNQPDFRTPDRYTPHIFVKELRNASSNQTTFYPLGNASANTSGSWKEVGFEVDSDKTYMYGVWVRVRDKSIAIEEPASRVSLVSKAQTGSGLGTGQVTYDGVLSYDTTNFYTTSVSDHDLVEGEWKLMTTFYLPSSTTATEREEWHDNYWAKWAGDYEFGNGINPTIQAVDRLHGLSGTSAIDGRIVKMDPWTGRVFPSLKVEWYSGNDLWLETAYPFFTEIDPMNIKKGGHQYFWDFEEQ